MKWIVLPFATGLGLGYFPKAPGTFGSLLGVGVFALTLHQPLWVQALVALGLFIVAVWSSNEACRIFQRMDDQRIVIDEVVGQYIALMGITSLVGLVWGFVLFRFFDIIKVFPVDWVDERMKGGLGVVLDDVISGYYALACLMLAKFLGLLA